eukprot:s341_g17.t1
MQLAGSNPVLRLSLAHPPTADPGFFQLKYALLDFRRLCKKSPDLMQFWQIFMSRYDGTTRDGPFSKILHLLSMVGWQVLEPPWIQDHDGFRHNLMTVPKQLLASLVYDAWMQYVATRVKHKTMSDLVGLDTDLTQLDHAKLDALNLARVRALQSGAFVSSWQHAKYDKTKQPICQHCLVPDTQQHWLRCPRFAAIRTECRDTFSWIAQAPSCTVLHLLVPRSGFATSWKQYFFDLPDLSCVFLSEPRQGIKNQVFTDGSFFQGNVKLTNRAAWAVVNASTGLTISHGPVPGLLQTIGRAELWACISATEWALKYDTDIILWTDSAGTCAHFNRLLTGTVGPTEDANEDLWLKLTDLLAHLRDGQLEVRWIPSHVDYALCSDALEEFLAVWNNVVDQQAVATNLQRGTTFDALLTETNEYYTLWTTRLRALRDFYLGVAHSRQDEPDIIDLTEDSDELAERVFSLSLGDALSVDWQHQLRRQSDDLALPVEFVSFLINACVAEEPLQESFVAISFVELTLWIVQTLNAQFPIEKTTAGQWSMRAPADMLLKPTVASLSQKVRSGLKSGLKVLGLEHYLCTGATLAPRLVERRCCFPEMPRACDQFGLDLDG